jgi:hypothetical protein
MNVRECKCKDTTCYDKTIGDIGDAFDNNLDEIDPRNAENIRRYPQEIIGQYNRRQASIDDSGTVRRDYSEVCAGNEGQLTPQDDDDSLAISIFLEEISEDIDLTHTVSGQQFGIPGWLYPTTTRDKGSSDMRGVVQITRPAPTRTNQCREANGSLGNSTANLDHMQENARRDMPQDDRLNYKQEDLACAIDQGDKQNDEGDVAKATAPGRPGSIPSTGDARWQPIADSLGYAPGKSASNLDALRAVRDEPADNPAQMNEGHSKSPQLNHYDRVIIEWCCGRKSMLGKSSKHSGGCKVVRLTIDDDLRTSEGLQKAIQVLLNCPRGRTLLWSSMPCAGGNPWQTLNAAMGEGLGKIEGRWRDLRLLWSNFELMARAVMDIGGKVVIEWPERCKCWTDISVMRFVKQHSFVDSIFHGCAYGLVTKHNMPIGQPMKKPWRSSSNDPIMLSFPNRKCQSGHDHAECRGRDCKASEDYTPAVVDAIHSGFLQSCGPSDEKLVGKCNDDTLQAVEMGLPGVESLDAFFGGTNSLSTSTDNLICVSKRSRITLGHSRSTRTPLCDIATTTHGTTAGIANHAPSPSMSCGYVSDVRSGNIAKNVDVRTSFPYSEDIEYDGDHAGISDDLSRIGEVSAIDEALFLRRSTSALTTMSRGGPREVWTT